MPEPEKKPADDSQGGGADDGAAGDDAKKSAAPKPITFDSQEALDKVIQDRVRRATPSDYEDLKAKAAKHDEAENAKKSDADKARDAQAEAERKAAERTSNADAKLRRAAILEAAVAAKAADTDIVLALLASDSSITVDDAGEVSGAKAAVKKLLDSKPMLKSGALPGAAGGEFGGNDQRTIDERIAELERAGKYAEARDLKVQKGLGVK